MPDKALHNLRRLALSEIGAVIAMGIVALGAFAFPHLPARRHAS
jgi:hypothetical protein